METHNNRLTPSRAIHPGEILREELLAREIKQKDFACLIGVSPTHLNEVIKGKRDINRDLAIKLEQQLGIRYESWMRLQDAYYYDTKVIAERKVKMDEARSLVGKTVIFESEVQEPVKMSRLAEIVKATRNEQKLTQKALSEMAGVSSRVVSRIQNSGDVCVSILDRVLNALGLGLTVGPYTA